MFKATTREGPAMRDLPGLLRPDKAVAESVARAVDPVFRVAMRETFKAEGPAGQPWKALSPEYKKRKDRLFSRAIALNQSISQARTGKRLSRASMRKALGSENKILQLSGRMMRAYTKAGGEHVARGAVLPRRGLVVFLGVHGPEYYAQHHDGAPPLPQRRVLVLSKRQVAEMSDAAQKAMMPHLLRRIRAISRARGFAAQVRRYNS
jgi:hypothetical protein